jgi:hypothetical protein
MFFIEEYFDIISTCVSYPKECKPVFVYLTFQQFLFVMLNIFVLGYVSDMIDIFFILFLDVGWQIILSLYLVNNIHYILLKNEIESEPSEAS